MDEQSLFIPKIVNRSALPWYDRSLIQDLTQFGPDYKDDFTVFLTHEAVVVLHEGTYQHAPFEAFGLLMGRAFADERGCFTIVSSVVYADDLNDVSQEHIHLSAEEVYRLRQEALRTYPTADFVGWTHSHSFFSAYSQIDLREQKTWTESYNIGILTFMDRVSGRGHSDAPWAMAYRGPRSEPLALSIDAFSLEEQPTLRFTENAVETALDIQREAALVTDPQEELTGSKTKTRSRFWPGQANGWTSFLIVLLLLVIVIVGVILGDLLFFHLPLFKIPLR